MEASFEKVVVVVVSGSGSYELLHVISYRDNNNDNSSQYPQVFRLEKVK